MQGWKKNELKKPTWVLLFFFGGVIGFLLLITFLAVYQCLNAFTVLAHAGVLKNTQDRNRRDIAGTFIHNEIR